jgi:UDP-N-acetylmuramoyl-tripeptide--D-alanyl-D-alanine ligase
VTALLYALTSAGALLWLALIVRPALVAARMLQIEEYERARFVHWAANPRWIAHPSMLAGMSLAVLALIAAATTGAVAPEWRDVIVAVGWIIASAAGLALWRWTPPKKRLVFTARMKRLLATTTVWLALVAAGGAALTALHVWPADAVVVLALEQTMLVVIGSLLLGNYAARPVEAAVRGHYLRLARTKIAAIDAAVVAVVGSYGKTSTKHILAQLLQPSVETLPTRQSFNTLMGVSRVINEDLQPQHRVFVVEMDAYGPGEIAAISALVHPTVAVLTSVGPQHLERFGSMQRITAALYEVVAALPPQGTAVIHTGDEGGASLAKRAADEGHRTVRYALAGDDNADVVASDVQLNGRGARFRWSWPAEQLQFDVSIPLLGRHQVLNVSAALATVHVLGYDVAPAVAAAAALEPVEHRLQLLRTGGPVTVIDDSYNANPVGVHNGLDVLAAMQAGARILVTPGIVELGSVEDEENRKYGEHAAKVCDQVIVVAGGPADALVRGLHDGGLADAGIHVVRTLAEATSLIGQLARAGDVVLFANDLPDTYMP